MRDFDSFRKNLTETDRSTASELGMLGTVGNCFYHKESFLRGVHSEHIPRAKVLACKERVETAIKENNIQMFKNALNEQCTVSGILEDTRYERYETFGAEEKITTYYNYDVTIPYLDSSERASLLGLAIKNYRVDMVKLLLEDKNNVNDVVKRTIQEGYRDICRLIQPDFEPESESESDNKSNPELSSKSDIDDCKSLFLVVGALTKETRTNTLFASTMCALLGNQSDREINAREILKSLLRYMISQGIPVSAYRNGDLYEGPLNSLFSTQQKDLIIKILKLQRYFFKLGNVLKKCMKSEVDEQGIDIIHSLLQKIETAFNAFKQLATTSDGLSNSAQVDEIIREIAKAFHEAEFEKNKNFSASIFKSEGKVGVLLNEQLNSLKEKFPDYFQRVAAENTKWQERRL